MQANQSAIPFSVSATPHSVDQSAADDALRRLVPRLFGRLMERRVYLLVMLIVSGLIAVVISRAFVRRTWKPTCSLLYTPVSVSEDIGVYTPPALSTLTELVRTPAVLEQLIDQHGLPIPVRAVQQCVQVSAPAGTQTVSLTLEWEHDDDSEAMLNTLLSVFVNRVGEVRREQARVLRVEREQSLVRNSQRVNELRTTLEALGQDVAVKDPVQELADLRRSVVLLESSIEREQRRHTAIQLQLNEIDAQLTSLRDAERIKGEQAAQEEATENTIADNRRRQDRLNELIAEERLFMTVTAQLHAKQNELDRANRLLERDNISPQKVEDLEAEVRTLKAKIAENEQIVEWKRELEAIDDVVVPKSSSRRASSPIIQQTLAKKLDLDLELLACASEIQQQQETLSRRQRRLEGIETLPQQKQSLTRQVRAAEEEQSRLVRELAALRHLETHGDHDFTVLSAPNLEVHPPASNRKVLFIGVFVAVLGTCCFPCLAIDTLHLLYRDVRHFCEARRVSVLQPPSFMASVKTDRGETTEHSCGDWSEFVSLRILQVLTAAEQIIAFSGLQPKDDDVTLIQSIGRCLSLRGERVVIVHVETETARCCEDSSASWTEPGVSDYLTGACTDLSDCVRPSSWPSLEYMPAGNASLTWDVCVSDRMRDMLDQLRQTYSRIIIAGPPAARLVDFEAVAGHANAIALLIDSSESLSDAGRFALESLLETNAALMGAVVRP